MTDLAPEHRGFSVQGRPNDDHRARIVAEASFEAAAVAYVEDLHLGPDAESLISVIVRDLETGAEHCFMIDLATGETSECG